MDYTLVRHGEAAVRIAAGDGPVANDPGVAVLVGARDADGALDGDELAAQRLPKVEAVEGRVEDRVLGGDVGDGVGDGIDVTAIEAAVLLRRRGQGVDADDERGDRVTL